MKSQLLSFTLVEEAGGVWRLTLQGGNRIAYRFPTKVAALTWLDTAIELRKVLAS